MVNVHPNYDIDKNNFVKLLKNMFKKKKKKK
jgi:hypothetical protein